MCTARGRHDDGRAALVCFRREGQIEKGAMVYMQGFPNGLPLEDARSIILNVAYGLQETHCDGIIHRRVCPSTVLVPDAPCCDTARSAHANPATPLLRPT